MVYQGRTFLMNRRTFIKKALTLTAGLIIAPKAIVEALESVSKPSLDLKEHYGIISRKEALENIPGIDAEEIIARLQWDFINSPKYKEKALEFALKNRTTFNPKEFL